MYLLPLQIPSYILLPSNPIRSFHSLSQSISLFLTQHFLTLFNFLLTNQIYSRLFSSIIPLVLVHFDTFCIIRSFLSNIFILFPFPFPTFLFFHSKPVWIKVCVFWSILIPWWLFLLFSILFFHPFSSCCSNYPSLPMFVSFLKPFIFFFFISFNTEQKTMNTENWTIYQQQKWSICTEYQRQKILGWTNK